jgi:cobalt/nickel transport system permease protein
MRDRVALLLYVAAIVAATCVHDPRLLAAGIALAGLLAGRDAARLARRAALAILVFNSAVTISYVVLASLHGELSLGFLLLINLRVFLLTYLTFLFQRRVNLFRALAFSPTLLHILAVAYGQIVTFRRLLADFRLALRSRRIDRLGLRDLYRHGAATAAFFLGKSLRDATEIGQAMTSRGFFHDQG